MAKDFIGYQALTDAALRGVVRDALRRIEKQGLVGSHHFYLTFKTKFPGVDIPDFLREIIPGRPRVEIGWQLKTSVWGQGLAPEGAHAWLEYAFADLGLDEIVAFTANLNLPSQRVMQKLGMHRNPDDDFDHPNLPVGHRLRRHVLYRIASPAR